MLIQSQSELVIIIADHSWGAPYVFHALRQEETCLWLELEPQDAGDAVAMGNKLADAVIQSLGYQLFGHAMPYAYGVSVLRDNLGLFEPLNIILSAADYGQDLALELVRFRRPGCRVILQFDDVPTEFAIPEDALILQDDDFKLQESDVSFINRERLTATEAMNLLRLTRGKYEAFMIQLHKRLNFPPMLRPGPAGAQTPPGAEGDIPPQALIQVYVRRNQWLEALELAASKLPERIPELLPSAGEAYLDMGLYGRLWTILSDLPGSLQNEEQIIYWQLRTAWRLGKTEDLRAKTEKLLAQSEAPDVRALYATYLAPAQERYAHVERAFQVAQSFTTMQQYGLHLLGRDLEASLRVFAELAERSKQTESFSRQALALSLVVLPLTQLGRYGEAAYRLEEAIVTFDRHGLGDYQFRMHTVNNWAYARILLGETVGLQEILRKEERALRDAFPSLAFIFRSTLGDYLLSQGRARDALVYYQENLELLRQTNPTQSAEFPPHISKDVVHCLLHLGKYEEASQLARKHYRLNREADRLLKAFTSFAYGMTLCFSEPDKAIDILEEAALVFEKPLIAPYLASVSLFQAFAYLELKQEVLAKACLLRAEAGLRELSDTGFQLLAGPEKVFRKVHTLWRGGEAQLKLRFMGAYGVTLMGEKQSLTLQWCEILALLAYHPKGLSTEQLLIELYGDEGNPATLSTTMSRLRRVIPVTRALYQLEVSVQADFLDLENHLRQGRPRAALELYQGGFLARSDAPGIVMIRETLEEAMRQTALDSGDAEVLLSLAERLRDDLELWEATLEVLPKRDPRYSLAAAKHKVLKGQWDV